MAVNVYVSIFPQHCFICVHMPISGLFLFGAILVHARHRETTGVLNRSPQCGLGYCCICGIWLLFRVEGGLYFLYFWILDPGF